MNDKILCNASCDYFVMILTLALLIVIGYKFLIDSFYDSKTDAEYDNDSNNEPESNKREERFGALQSLYSNDGPQDAYLTIENDPNLYYDPYGYWRGVTWNLPTRNLNAIAFYPYLYERYVDRYATIYPYWSL